MQLALAPPFPPAQLHDHGPLPVTDEAAPVVHRLVVGALLREAPFEDPHAPLTGSGRLHEAVVPPLLPAQFQVVVVPLSAVLDDVPAVQLLAVAPHAPLTAAGFRKAVQLALAPPLAPAQLHDHGPLPLTDEAVPVVHKLVVGTLLREAPFDKPHAPLTGSGRLHEAVVPPLLPAQFQVVVVPLFAVFDDVPAVQLLALTPHAPLTATSVREAVQLALAPPLAPAQLHDHGPEPLTEDAAPVVHRLLVGTLLSEAPFEDPHAPLTATGAREAVQLGLAPPFAPAQLHDHGPLPLTAEAVPVVHRLVVGTLPSEAPLDDPHAPLTAPVVLATVKLSVRVLLLVLDSTKRPISLTHACRL